jgi:hypothetical protein
MVTSGSLMPFLEPLSQRLFTVPNDPEVIMPLLLTPDLCRCHLVLPLNAAAAAERCRCLRPTPE